MEEVEGEDEEEDVGEKEEDVGMYTSDCTSSALALAEDVYFTMHRITRD